MLHFASASEGTGTILWQLGLVLLLLGAAGRLAARIGIPSIPLYLVAGIAIGSSGLVDITESEDFLSIGAEVGVVLLLLLLGLEYSPQDLRDGVRANWMSGIFDLVANMTPGLLVGWVLGWSPVASLLLGGATYISSSGIIAKMLDDLGRIANRETPVLLSILVMEDIAMAVFLPVVGVMLAGESLRQGAVTVAIAMLLVTIAFVVSLRFGTHVSKLVHSRSRELLILTVLGLTFLVAGLADAVQVSAAVGAFLLGLTLSGQVADDVRDLLPPLRDVFGGMFFVFFGLQIDIGAMGTMIVPALILAVATAASKVFTGSWAAKRAGIGPRGRLRAGLSLIPRGEFSIVIAGLAVAAGITENIGALVAGYVLILAIGGTIAMRQADAISARFQKPAVQPPA